MNDANGVGTATAQKLVEPVLPLAGVGRNDIVRAGGKGTNLGELIRGGFPVPPGFVVSTAVYDEFVEEAGLRTVIEAELARGHAASVEDPQTGSSIRAAFEAADIPAPLASTITEAYDALGSGPVAVRSSATAEDLPNAAFAGQQDTFLNVVGHEQVLLMVQRCWASLWTDRAIAYRNRLGLDHGEVSLAVVVQTMVPARAAGVMFTANPVTGARDVVVIDATPGLGEAVVAGLVTPDHFALRRRRLRSGWKVVESVLGKRELVVRPLTAGGVEHYADKSTEEATSVAAAVPEDALRELAELGSAIAHHFGAPQDIEWAWDGRALFVVQSRPITALPDEFSPPGRPSRVFAGIIAEMMPMRPLPLEATTWGFERIFKELLAPMLQTFGLRVDYDGTFEESDGVVVRYTGKVPVRPTTAILTAPLRLSKLARQNDPDNWEADPVLTRVLARARELDARDLTGLDWAELLAAVNDSLDLPSAVGDLRVRYLAPRVLDVVRLRILLGLTGHGRKFATLFLTGVETKTMEANRRLETLAERVRTVDELAEAFSENDAADLMAVLRSFATGGQFLGELKEFLAEYGHREVGGTVQVSLPTWREAPEVVLGLLQGMAETGTRARTELPDWQRAKEEVLASRPMSLVPWLRAAFERNLKRARYFPGIREDTRFYGTMLLPSLRSALLEIGDRLARVEALESAEDLFHLKLAELQAITAWPPTAAAVASMRETVTRRRAVRASLERVPVVDPRYLRSELGAEDVLVSGAAGSPGTTEGSVRVVLDSSSFGTLQRGEVLVAPYTNPAWTPLFERAAAVVVDTGGPTSHAAIVAREYGIPAVMGTFDGTTVLADGTFVRVDGSEGLVVKAADTTSTVLTSPHV